MMRPFFGGRISLLNHHLWGDLRGVGRYKLPKNMVISLVVSTHLKHISQIGNHPQIGVE